MNNKVYDNLHLKNLSQAFETKSLAYHTKGRGKVLTERDGGCATENNIGMNYVRTKNTLDIING